MAAPLVDSYIYIILKLFTLLVDFSYQIKAQCTGTTFNVHWSRSYLCYANTNRLIRPSIWFIRSSLISYRSQNKSAATLTQSYFEITNRHFLNGLIGMFRTPSHFSSKSGAKSSVFSRDVPRPRTGPVFLNITNYIHMYYIYSGVKTFVDSGHLCRVGLFCIWSSVMEFQIF